MTDVLSFLQEVTWVEWLIVPVLLTQGIWLFLDAGRHGKYAWFWGILGLISFPLPSILYLVFVRKVFRSRK